MAKSGMIMLGNVARIAERRNAYNILIGEPKGKVPLSRPSRRWEENEYSNLSQRNRA
jgi:hypothetical protein